MNLLALFASTFVIVFALGAQSPAPRAAIYPQEGTKMLILTRRIDESLHIGSNVRVKVLGIKGNQVRIGIDAPDDVPVHREEIYRRIEKEKAAGVAIRNCPERKSKAKNPHERRQKEKSEYPNLAPAAEV